MMVANYKRRKPSLIRNFWIYRRLIGLACVTGVLLWFIWANREPVKVTFPFGFGTIQSSAGVLILASMFAGSILTVLTGMAVLAWKKVKSAEASAGADATSTESTNPRSENLNGNGSLNPGKTLIDDLPPPGYAGQTPEGFSPSRWS